jgi:SAM-dependent methyltransferase
MSTITNWLDATLYPGDGGDWGDEKFRSFILQHIQSTDSILDLGAGRGKVQQMNFRGVVKFVAGADPDPAAQGNPFVDEFKLISPTGDIPYPNDSFDLVFTNNVVEHVADPGQFFSEAYRVLKPNGWFLSKTPNKRHYVALIARSTPHYFHEYINRKRGRRDQDTFPTVYKCNTPKEVANYAAVAGFKMAEVRMWEGRPEYLRLWTISYLLGYLYEVLVNKFSFLSQFRCVIAFALQKPQFYGISKLRRNSSPFTLE